MRYLPYIAARHRKLSPFVTEGRELRLYRMPSSSRAYPMKLEKKAVFYRKMLEEIGLL